MKKKVGPLELWQWLAIGAALGVVYYVYKARQNAAANTGGTTATPTAGSATDLGPIDPTTGEPYSLEGGGGGGTSSTAAQNSGPTSLAQELSDLQSIQGLMAGFQQIQPTTGAGTTADDTGASEVAQATGTTTNVTKTVTLPSKQLKQITGRLNNLGGAVKKLTQQVEHPKNNPGHTVKTHAGGKKSASSSAPQNSRQHVNVAPPSHQRAPVTKHPTPPKPAPKPKPVRRRGP
jgi:hypothetical protein